MIEKAAVRFAACVCMLVVSAVATAQTSYELGRGLRVDSGGGVRWQFGGRFHIDSASFDPDLTPLADNADFRRARASLRVRVHDDWRVVADYDAGGVIRGWKNLYGQYRGLNHVRLTFGNQLVPFSMQEQTSSSDLGFLERALPDALSPGILTGVAFQTVKRHFSLSAGAFSNAVGNQEQRQADGHSLAFRITTAPIRHRKSVLRLGAAVEIRDLDTMTVRFRVRPESYMTSQRLVDTGTISGVDSVRTVGLEAGGKKGPFSIRTEYMRAQLSRPTASELTFGGAYVAASYLLTGESVDYDRRQGTFGGVRPKHRFGAIELVARASQVDLTDADVLGGVERNRSIGLNWYLPKSLRIMLDYVTIEARPNRNGFDESPKVLQFRFQVNL